IPQELAALCLLILRGPLTPGEINSNAGRLFNFDSIDEVQDVLNRLQEQEPPFVKQLAKRPGQKEVRYVHLLGEMNEKITKTSRVRRIAVHRAAYRNWKNG